ncbi:nucleoside-diphosphate-sugar epimerase [Pseudomonas sp. GM21]|uniref:UDP-glucose 4-epimerase family protein n=1 Tax=Pseudomonas sp. GM21 TaxID=1144325 RepID=UPI00027235BB|nr:SDR family oxidoreductase [Pseudomonas sp. GM21]EJM19368.1 nucleoside-diphosphate-sugar epimerase [Pseudomonas sp. GM21]
MRVLVTGSSGFVGNRLLNVLANKKNVEVFAAARGESIDGPATVRLLKNFELSSAVDWTPNLIGFDVVVHAAARVHVMNDQALNPLEAFRAVNVKGTLKLAEQAASAGVRRFVFISSIKVNGESTTKDDAYSPDAVPAPLDPYGVSKMEAESGLKAIAQRTGMEVVIIRPVLVYGPGVKANFLKMMQWLDKGFPLPFGAIRNSRSLVALDNLVDLIILCMEHPAAANQTFMVSDGEDLSTTELLRRMACALDKPARLLPVPEWILRLGASLFGKSDLLQRLCGSLRVDISKTRDVLGWKPLVSVDSALKEAAIHFQESRKQ